VIVKQCDADAWSARIFYAVEIIGLVEGIADFLADFLNLGSSIGRLGGKSLQNENKLVPTEPGNGIPVPDRVFSTSPPPGPEAHRRSDDPRNH